MKYPHLIGSAIRKEFYLQARQMLLLLKMDITRMLLYMGIPPGSVNIAIQNLDLRPFKVMTAVEPVLKSHPLGNRFKKLIAQFILVCDRVEKFRDITGDPPMESIMVN